MNQKVLFVGLGLGGCRIVKELIELGYSGMMIDCSSNNKKRMNLEDESHYYTIGGFGGTGGSYKLGKEYIEKGTWCIQPTMRMLRRIEYIVIIGCAESGVMGGIEPLVREIRNRYYPVAKLGVLSILPSKYSFETINEIVNGCRENMRYMRAKFIDNYMFFQEEELFDGICSNREIVEFMHGLFNDETIVDKIDDTALCQFINNREGKTFNDNKSLLIGEERDEKIEELKGILRNNIVEYSNSQIEYIKQTLIKFDSDLAKRLRKMEIDDDNQYGIYISTTNINSTLDTLKKVLGRIGTSM
ncbi:MAG: hypothetical protein E7231_00045 [Cellulosilyticum sp.]|nr:hypothetical protein [Cellulosilyticum sp.]